MKKEPNNDRKCKWQGIILSFAVFILATTKDVLNSLTHKHSHCNEGRSEFLQWP